MFFSACNLHNFDKVMNQYNTAKVFALIDLNNQQCIHKMDTHPD